MMDDKDRLEDSFVKSKAADSIVLLRYDKDRMIESLRRRAQEAEAGAAAMREALEHARCALAHITPSGHDGDEDSGQCDEDCALCDVQSASDHLDAALATDAGKALLERVRRAEDRVRRAESGRARNLHACRSLYRAWRRERDVQAQMADQSLALAGSLHAAEDDRDAAQTCKCGATFQVPSEK